MIHGAGQVIHGDNGRQRLPRGQATGSGMTLSAGTSQGWDESVSTTGSWEHVVRIEETTMGENGHWHGRHWGDTRAAREWGSAGSQQGSSAVDGLGNHEQRSGRATEKMLVPEFDGEGSEQELGKSARSYVRKVQAWLKCTRMAELERPLAWRV